MTSKKEAESMLEMEQTHNMFSLLLPEPKGMRAHAAWLDKKAQWWRAYLAGRKFEDFVLERTERRSHK